MSNSNDFVPFAVAAGANTETPAAYAADVTRQQGVQAGTASSILANTAWRQASSIASMVAQFTADYGPANVVDNGNIAGLEAQFIAALTQFIDIVVGPDYLFEGTDDGSPDNVHVSVMSPAVTAYANNQFYLVTILDENVTNSPHFQIGSLGSLPIKLSDGTPCPVGYLQPSARVTLANCGSYVQLMGGFRSQIPEMNGVTVNQTTTWGPVPPGVIGLENVWGFGAGGGGAGASGPAQWGFGGAAGGVFWKAFLPCNPGDYILIEVGSGASTGGLAGAAGNQGGDTIIHGSVTLTATGGTGGSLWTGSGSTGGTASGDFDFGHNGDNGSAGEVVLDESANAMAVGGVGGGVPFGGARTRLVWAGLPGHDGAQGEFPGGGGGSGATPSSGSTQNGGDGADGVVFFQYRTATI